MRPLHLVVLHPRAQVADELLDPMHRSAGG
jgi:hypothetical protein